MISLKNTLEAIKSAVSSINSSISSINSTLSSHTTQINAKASKTWTLVNSATSSNTAYYTNLNTLGYKEVLIVINSSKGMHTMNIPVDRLTTSLKEAYLGGGVGSSLQASRRAVINVALTRAHVLAYDADGVNQVPSCTLYVYAR